MAPLTRKSIVIDSASPNFGDLSNIGFHVKICREITYFAVTSACREGYKMNCIETQALDIFREYLKDKKYRDIERFFNEWKMTFHSDGPFKTEQDLQLLGEKMTKPDDFMVRTIIPLVACSVSASGVMLQKVKIRDKLERKNRLSGSQTKVLDISKIYPINSIYSPRP